ncbi:MAG TPA: ribosome recycling factor [Thermoanaerobaculia bacterium]|nr:ribosome recycling factor [Thermoanaerobaculia bacterium]
MEVRELLKDLDRRMHGAIEALHSEFKQLRTGRASLSMLDGVVVPYYGNDSPLNQVASLSVPETSLIVAQPWDRSLIPAIEKAIRSADLGFNPASDGQVVRIPVPPLTEERRKELVKKAHHMAEEVRTAIRQVRRDGNDKVKKLQKDHQISEDEEKRTHDEIQKLTDKYIAEVATVLEHKEAEIMEV